MAPAVVRILRRCVANTSQVLVQLASSLQTSRGSLKPTGATRTVDASGQAWGQRLLKPFMNCDRLYNM